MSETLSADAYGVLIEPATLRIERRLPGPIERVWAYLTEEELRRKWLAAGQMELMVGAPFTFVWRNDTLTDPPGARPESASRENRLDCTVLEANPPRRLAITWGENGGEVLFELAPIGEEVLLTLTHRRAPDRQTLLGVSAGWHAHLDVLAARTRGTTPAPFWDNWHALKEDYARRF